MFETEKLTREIIEQRRKVQRPISRQYRKGIIKKHCCNQCGQPKAYVCLTHSEHLFRPSFFKVFKKLFKKTRYFARKLFFTAARRLGFDL